MTHYIKTLAPFACAAILIAVTAYAATPQLEPEHVLVRKAGW